jgi:hypothetical protein
MREKRERDEALEQLAATSDVLQIIRTPYIIRLQKGLPRPSLAE